MSIAVLPMKWYGIATNVRKHEGPQQIRRTFQQRQGGRRQGPQTGQAPLGAEPLIRAIDDLARRARLRVDDKVATASRIAAEPSPLGLTDRELQVLRLVNEGLSNREIGDALFISIKTASVHVSNILRKLGAANRIEAAAIGRRHRILER